MDFSFGLAWSKQTCFAEEESSLTLGGSSPLVAWLSLPIRKDGNRGSNQKTTKERGCSVVYVAAKGP